MSALAIALRANERARLALQAQLDTVNELENVVVEQQQRLDALRSRSEIAGSHRFKMLFRARPQNAVDHFNRTQRVRPRHFLAPHFRLPTTRGGTSSLHFEQFKDSQCDGDGAEKQVREIGEGTAALGVAVDLDRALAAIDDDGGYNGADADAQNDMDDDELFALEHFANHNHDFDDFVEDEDEEEDTEEESNTVDKSAPTVTTSSACKTPAHAWGTDVDLPSTMLNEHTRAIISDDRQRLFYWYIATRHRRPVEPAGKTRQMLLDAIRRRAYKLEFEEVSTELRGHLAGLEAEQVGRTTTSHDTLSRTLGDIASESGSCSSLPLRGDFEASELLGRFQRLHSQQLTDQELHASVQQRFDRSQWESIARDFDITAAECKFVWEHRAVGGYVRKECHEKRTTPWTECEIRIVERVVSEQWALESKDQTYVGTLTNLRQRRAIDWRSIAHEAGTGRQPGEFFARYKREMIRLRSVDRQHSSRGANSNTTAALPLSSRKRGRTGNEAEAKLKQHAPLWDRTNDEILLRMYQLIGPLWDDIARCLPGGKITGEDCHARFKRSINPDLRHGRWSDEEDKILKRAVDLFRKVFGEEAKLRWNEIAPLVPNRTEPKCRERWFNAFDTRRSRLPFSEDEDVRLVGMVSDWLQQQLRERAVQGNARRSSRPPTIPWMAWTDHFPGRASVEIKNRYNTIRVVRRLPSVREVLQSGGQMMADDNSASKS